MRFIKVFSAMMFLFVLVLAGCNSDENRANNNSSSKGPTASTPVTTPSDGARRITIDELKAEWEKKKGDIVFIDTRGPEPYKTSHIKGALLLADFQQRAAEFPPDKMIVTYCT